MAFCRDERVKDLVNMIENPDEQAYVGSEDLDEMEIYDMETDEIGEDALYDDEGDID